MKWKIIFPITFVLFSVILAYIILYVRVNNVTLDDPLGLLNHMPIFYVPMLFLSALFCLFAFYYKQTGWSVAFAALFIGYFALVPYCIEPLRVKDMFYHFSRVVTVLQNGHIPPPSASNEYYFQYPGSTFFGAIFLEITGIQSTLFLKIIFPFMQTAIFSLGFAVIVKKIFKTWTIVGPSLLLVVLFDYGGYHFSPYGFAWMLIPLLLLPLMSRDTRSSPLIFILLSFTLIISHPTTSIFLLVILPALFLFLALSKKTSPQRLNTLLICVSVYVIMTFSWIYFMSPSTLEMITNAITSSVQTLFSHSQNVPGLVLQKTYYQADFSILRRIFVVLTSVLALIALALCITKMRKTSKATSQEKEWLGLSIVFICIGMLGFLLFSVSSESVFSFTYSFTFGLFGVAIAAVGLLPAKSKKTFALLLIITLALILPAFTTRYVDEYEDIIRQPILAGLAFAGAHINNDSLTIVSPESKQLYSFMNYLFWSNIAPPNNDNTLLSQVQKTDYFIYRTEGLYDAAIATGLPVDQTIYYNVSNSMVSSNTFNLIYSNPDYDIYVRTPLR